MENFLITIDDHKKELECCLISDVGKKPDLHQNTTSHMELGICLLALIYFFLCD